MPTTYPELYFPVVVQIVIAIAVAAGLIGASTLLGKHGHSPLKDTPYESGMAPVGSARERFSVKFYLVGMIFILFDIEAVFLFPWVVVFRELKLSVWPKCSCLSCWCWWDFSTYIRRACWTGARAKRRRRK